MKKLLSLICAVLLALMLCACAAKAQPAETPEPTPETPAPTEAPAETDKEDDGEQIYVRFKTETMDGESVDESIFEGHRLIILNFWEPWCRPCVAEMPDLQKVYENYSEEGFLMIGVYSTEDGAAEAVADTGVQYPIIKYTDEFEQFMTGYVPTSIVVNGEGRLVGGPYIGGGSYADWAAVVEVLMK